MKYVINKFVKYYISIFFIITLTQQNHTQTNFSKDLPSGLSNAPIINVIDTTISEIKVDKNYWLPVIEVVGLNLGIGAFNAYLMNEDFAKISWKTIGDNFKTGFVWDEDGYLTNQFMHPFHGANYFNAARSNGLGFWESAPYAIFGSLMWEFTMENEPPSYNDIVNTPVTGIILGEISFRVSNLIIDESSEGLERFLREFTSTVIDPMQGFNRLIRGDMWKDGAPNKKSNFNIMISSGVHNVFIDNKMNNSKSYITLRTDLDYGNEFSVIDHKKPFDYFTLRTEFNIANDDNIVGVFASGVLWDNKLKLFENSKNIIGIYKEVDIHINTVYKLSATSVTGQIINTIPISSITSMQNYFGLSAILMGGTNSQYSIEYGKDYNIGPGASAKIGAKMKIKNFGELYSNYKRYWIHTLSGADGEEFVGLFNIGLNYSLLDNTSLGLDYLLYERYGEYKYFPNTHSSNAAIRLFISQNI